MIFSMIFSTPLDGDASVAVKAPRAKQQTLSHSLIVDWGHLPGGALPIDWRNPSLLPIRGDSCTRG